MLMAVLTVLLMAVLKAGRWDEQLAGLWVVLTAGMLAALSEKSGDYLAALRFAHLAARKALT